MGSRAENLPVAMPPLHDRQHLASLITDLERLGEDPAVVERRGLRRERTSYGELARLAGRYAHELEARGITKGERVGDLGRKRKRLDRSIFRMYLARRGAGSAGCRGLAGIYYEGSSQK